MIRLIFRIVGTGGKVEYHTAEVVGEKAALLVGKNQSDVVGVELCEDPVGKWQDPVKSLARKHTGWLRDVPWIHRQQTKPDLSQVGLDALKDEIALRELVKKREENPPEKPVSEISTDGGFLIPPEIAKQVEAEFPPAGPAGFISVDDPGAQEPPNPESVAEYFRETLASRRKKAEEEAGEDPRVLHENGLHTKLWLLLRPNGEFVKSTTEEGGESYIACTSFDEAQKVAEQQKIYDIECVPHRVF